MSAELQARAKAFVARQVPPTLDYAPGSIAERVLQHYADKGTLERDSEYAELLELATAEAARAVDRHDGDAREYLAEGASILSAIAETL